ncbi:hypothetical protein RHMOL_Rhmol11G0144200 [Rhododendron molle]|uniref:Uncharacterized protein n=1 Tax=Rhododendron molle TaxID=49168 RepID=A0ACC0LT86_RHOML|nr:hypothetical protein RHMOL_Rhmol11G0144200 [Rhododendron molle]
MTLPAILQPTPIQSQWLLPTTHDDRTDWLRLSRLGFHAKRAARPATSRPSSPTSFPVAEEEKAVESKGKTNERMMKKRSKIWHEKKCLLRSLVVDLPDDSTTATTTVVVALPAHPHRLAHPREQPETGSGAIIVIGLKNLLSSPLLSSLSLDSSPEPRRMMTGLDRNRPCGIFTSLYRTSQPQPPSIDGNPLSLRLQSTSHCDYS